MKVLIGLLILIVAGCGGRAARNEAASQNASAEPDAPADEKSQTTKQGGRYGVKIRVIFKSRERERLQPHNEQICMLAGSLPGQFRYTDIGQIVTSKGTYGQIDEVLHAMADEGRRIGVDAITDLQARQRGSVMPWRYSTPISKGRLVKLSDDSPPLDCEAIEGKLN
jgi:hypothetical protein